MFVITKAQIEGTRGQSEVQ